MENKSNNSWVEIEEEDPFQETFSSNLFDRRNFNIDIDKSLELGTHQNKFQKPKSKQEIQKNSSMVSKMKTKSQQANQTSKKLQKSLDLLNGPQLYQERFQVPNKALVKRDLSTPRNKESICIFDQVAVRKESIRRRKTSGNYFQSFNHKQDSNLDHGKPSQTWNTPKLKVNQNRSQIPTENVIQDLEQSLSSESSDGHEVVLTTLNKPLLKNNNTHHTQMRKRTGKTVTLGDGKQVPSQSHLERNKAPSKTELGNHHFSGVIVIKVNEDDLRGQSPSQGSAWMVEMFDDISQDLQMIKNKPKDLRIFHLWIRLKYFRKSLRKLKFSEFKTPKSKVSTFEMNNPKETLLKKKDNEGWAEEMTVRQNVVQQPNKQDQLPTPNKFPGSVYSPNEFSLMHDIRRNFTFHCKNVGFIKELFVCVEIKILKEFKTSIRSKSLRNTFKDDSISPNKDQSGNLFTKIKNYMQSYRNSFPENSGKLEATEINIAVHETKILLDELEDCLVKSRMYLRFAQEDISDSINFQMDSKMFQQVIVQYMLSRISKKLGGFSSKIIKLLLFNLLSNVIKINTGALSFFLPDIKMSLIENKFLDFIHKNFFHSHSKKVLFILLKFNQFLSECISRLNTLLVKIFTQESIYTSQKFSEYEACNIEILNCVEELQSKFNKQSLSDLETLCHLSKIDLQKEIEEYLINQEDYTERTLQILHPESDQDRQCLHYLKSGDNFGSSKVNKRRWKDNKDSPDPGKEFLLINKDYQVGIHPHSDLDSSENDSGVNIWKVNMKNKPMTTCMKNKILSENILKNKIQKVYDPKKRSRNQIRDLQGGFQEFLINEDLTPETEIQKGKSNFGLFLSSFKNIYQPLFPHIIFKNLPLSIKDFCI